MKWRRGALAGGALLAACVVGLRPMAQLTPAASPSIARQMKAFWQGKAHFHEVRDVDWAKPPYNAPREGEGWFGNPMPFPGGKWYLFNRQWMTQKEKPTYCPQPGFRIVVRESSDQGKTWTNPSIVAAAPGSEGAPDACGVVDGSSYYDQATNTWQMLTQCLAAHNNGGWMLCHYVRYGPSPLGRFMPDVAPAVRGGQLWSRICAHSGGICDAHRTVDEGTPDIVYKKGGYFYVTFHGYDYSTKHGFRGVAKTTDFHHWIVAGPDLPDAPVFASPECQSWNPGCVGGGEASTLIAGNYQYMMIETPNKVMARVSDQNWPFALLRAPAGRYPAWNSPLWQKFSRNPVLPDETGRGAHCAVAYARWAVAASHVYIFHADYGCGAKWPHPYSVSANRLLELTPGAPSPHR